jgi:hypothetical protein
LDLVCATHNMIRLLANLKTVTSVQFLYKEGVGFLEKLIVYYLTRDYIEWTSR